MRELIVLTCTIRPSSTIRVKRSDPELRRADYIFAINLWAKFARKNGYDLLILENSDSAEMLSKFASREAVSVVPVKKDSRSINEGVSGGEYEMLKFGLTEEILKKYSVIWKVSGRNFISNAKRVLDFDYKVNLMCDRNFFPRHSCDSRVFGMTRDTWIDFLSLTPTFRNREHNDSSLYVFDSMEHFLTIFATNLEFSVGRQAALAHTPFFLGFSGSTNKEIMSRRRRVFLRVQRPIRPFIHKLLLGISP